MEKLNELYDQIDNDRGLQSKRKVLTIVSLILLILQFSGAKVVEVNTFLLKLSFEHQGGIGLLLVFSIFFLLIRYHNYAKKYHKILYTIWTSELMKNRSISWYDHHSDDIGGLLHESYPTGLGIENYQYREDRDVEFSFSYKCKAPFRRYFHYTRIDPHEVISKSTNIFKKLGFRKYLLVLRLEFMCQFSRYFTHRENLDIMSPYFLGGFAISSYILRLEFQLF